MTKNKRRGNIKSLVQFSLVNWEETKKMLHVEENFFFSATNSLFKVISQAVTLFKEILNFAFYNNN